MNRFSSYFSRPAPFNDKPWIVVIVASLLVCFLLAFFQPFGIENFSATAKYGAITGFTLVTVISTSIVSYLLPSVFRKFYNSSKWTIGKRFVNQAILMLLIALGNFFFDWNLTHRPSEEFWPVLLFYISVTFTIGFIPAGVMFFIVQNRNLRRNLNDAQAINDRLTDRLKNAVQLDHLETGTIVLSGSTKESVTLYPDSILYIESAGNYVIINYLHGDVVKHKQLRTTIAQVESYLCDFPYLARCHRAYMVNTAFISNIEGNSQGFQLRLGHIKEEVPVSRSYIKSIRSKL